jgi:hypothetical protein
MDISPHFKINRLLRGFEVRSSPSSPWLLLYFLMGISILCSPGCSQSSGSTPYQADGFQIEEVTDSRVTILARLTLNPEDPGPGADSEFRQGSIGEVQILYRASDSDDWLETDWRAVDPAQDYTRKFVIPSLKPDTEYLVRVASRGILEGPPGEALEGRFRTLAKSKP